MQVDDTGLHDMSDQTHDPLGAAFEAQHDPLDAAFEAQHAQTRVSVPSTCLRELERTGVICNKNPDVECQTDLQDILFEADILSKAGAITAVLFDKTGVLSKQPAPGMPDVLIHDAASAVPFILTQLRAPNQQPRMAVVSGDGPGPCRTVCARTGMQHSEDLVTDCEFLNISQLTQSAVTSNVVFARADAQKKADLVAAFQSQGHVVLYCGAGVNDVTALQAADLGVAIAGTAAVNNAADVLLTKNLYGIAELLKQGRVYRGYF